MKPTISHLAAFLVLAANACSSDPPPDPEGDTPELTPQAISQIEALLAEKDARTPAQRKISSQLLYAKSGRFDNVAPTKDPNQKIQSLAQIDARGRYLVDIKGNPDVVKGKIEALGGTIQSVSSVHNATRAWIDLAQVETLAGDDAVASVAAARMATTHRIDGPSDKHRAGATRAERVAAMQAEYAQWRETHPVEASFAPAAPGTGSVTSEGAKAHGAERARKFFKNADGTGITVGVLSDSNDHMEESIASGDLPANTIAIPGQDGRPGTGEGTAMMEIVHDVAPGANIVFATAFGSAEQFAENIRALRTQFHCDIIVDDVSYFAESPYEDDIIAAAVDDVSADGALYFSSAGNEGNFDDGTTGTWEGDFKPGGALATLPASGYTIHDFGSKVISNRIDKQGGPLYLQWSDPSNLDTPVSTNDYDLFVLDKDLRNVLVASTDIQAGAGLPFESLNFTIPEGLRVVIAAKPNAQARAMHLVIAGGELGLATPGSTYGHNSAASAFGVAAVDVAEAGGGEFQKGNTTPVEIFSSDGNRQVFYDRNGQPLNGGVTFASKGGVTRFKPDLTGTDGVTTTLPQGTGLSPFFGTSSAAPHAAAVAAIMKSAAPDAKIDDIRTALLTGALDIEAPLSDRDSGKGIVSAINSLSRGGAVKQAFLELNGTSNEPILPGAAGEVTINLVNNGGAKASSIKATLATSSPFVTINHATTTYPSLVNGATAPNTTALRFTVSPDAPCGTMLAFTLAIQATNQTPTTLAFSLPVGKLSAPTTVSYTGPAVAIPDGTPTGVDVPFAVPDVGNISKLVFRIDGSACSAVEAADTVGVDHTWVGDLTFKLTSPSGTQVTLLSAAGGPNNSGNNFCQTVLDDGATSSIESVTVDAAPFTGTFAPQQPLSTFIGQASGGTWTLNVSDSTLSDVGNVRAFSLDVSTLTCAP